MNLAIKTGAIRQSWAPKDVHYSEVICPAQSLSSAACLQALTREVRSHFRGQDLLYHGTRYPAKILESNVLLHASCGTEGVHLTRSPEVAAHWAAVPRPDDEGIGAILILERWTLRCRYALEPFHDLYFFDQVELTKDEMDEIIWRRNISDLDRYLAGIILLRSNA